MLKRSVKRALIVFRRKRWKSCSRRLLRKTGSKMKS